MSSRTLLFVSFLAAVAFPCGAQNHPELEWRMIETEHFRILYHQGLEDAAARAARIAEASYGPVTRLYHYEPHEKVRIVLKDYDDYANGAAFYYHDAIEIWTTALEHEYELRGSSDWLSNVITHEFTHIISLGAARRAPQRIPAFYLQYFGYQQEKNRPDILVGFPDVIASYPVMNVVVPMWFAEGVAQYMAEGAHHDHWDTHRDMILRIQVLRGRPLSFDQMGVFAKCGFGNEYVYDHGYGLVLYIAQTYGEDKLAELARASGTWRDLEFDAAIERVLGVKADRLYEDWIGWMRRKYEKQVAELGELREGDLISDEGFSNRSPAFSPDGRYLAYSSTRDQPCGPHLLVLRDLESGEEEVLASGISSTLSWSPDGRRILFVRIDRADKYGSRQADVYQYDLDGPEASTASELLWSLPSAVTGYAPSSPRIRRLTHGLRALYPSFSPDGEWIAFVHNEGTSNNLGLMRSDGTGIRYLTDFSDGTQLYTPHWSPDGRSLVFSISKRGKRDIALLQVNPEGEDRRLASSGPVDPDVSPFLRILVASSGEDRDPVWTPDGRRVVFSSDASGIFNLYVLDVETGRIRRLTNLVGGGFSPAPGPDGRIAFVSYGPDGFEIRQIDSTGGTPADSLFVQPEEEALRPIRASSKEEVVESRPYGSDFLRTSILPRLSIDEGKFKGGAYLTSGDVIGRQSLFAGVSVAPSDGDRDLFAVYEYRRWRPTLFLEFFHQKRGSARGDSSEARDLIVTGVDYNLFQTTLGLRRNLGKQAKLTLSFTYDRYDASVKSETFVPRRDGGVGFERIRQKPFGYTYLHGFDLGLTYQMENLARRGDREISPRGRRIYFRYDRKFNYFIEGFDQNSSFIDEKYLHLFYHQFTLDWKEYIGLPWNSALGLRLYGGWIASDKVDDPDAVNHFFDYHIGGLPYMKGYTFYSVEGRKVLMGTLTLRFPIVRDGRRRLGNLYFDKLYGALYGDVGKGWDGKIDEPDRIYGRKGPLRDLGGQVRVDLVSWYSMPTCIQADLAYGIDELEDKSPWKFYLTVMFGYL